MSAVTGSCSARECRVAAHSASAVRREREMSADPISLSSSYSVWDSSLGDGAATFRVGLPPFVNSPWKPSSRHSQRRVPWVTPNPVKSTMKTKQQSWGVGGGDGKEDNKRHQGRQPATRCYLMSRAKAVKDAAGGVLPSAWDRGTSLRALA